MMKNKALNTIERFGMISQGETVVVGVSGGADSVSLLHLLCELRRDWGISVIAAHLNHMLRGKESDSDERYVKELCELQGVTYVCQKADCSALAKEAGEGLEECGRRLRYELYDKIAAEYGAKKIATAHTASDNFETLILNITRGSSLKGVCGIPPKRENIIRPLIECSREEIEQYCADNNLDYVTDSTNSCDEYVRNRIRNQVIPVLTSINPNAVFAAAKFCRLASEDEAFLKEMSDTLFEKAKIKDGEFDAAVLREAEKPIRSRLFVTVIEQMTAQRPSGKDTINAVEEVLSGGGKVQLHKNLFVELKRNHLAFYGKKEAVRLTEIYPDGLEFCVNTGVYRVRCIRCKNDKNVNDLLTKNYVDCDTICGRLVLRGRKQGDKITLGKRNVTKTLKKLFSEERIDEETRNLIPVLADECGVVWVMGFGANARNAANEKSTNVIKVEGENIC